MIGKANCLSGLFSMILHIGQEKRARVRVKARSRARSQGEIEGECPRRAEGVHVKTWAREYAHVYPPFLEMWDDAEGCRLLLAPSRHSAQVKRALKHQILNVFVVRTMPSTEQQYYNFGRSEHCEMKSRTGWTGAGRRGRVVQKYCSEPLRV